MQSVRRAHDSWSSDTEESAARRRRRASNVVESLRELMLVPTSSTLGEITTEERTNPRSAHERASDSGDTGGGASTNENGTGSGGNINLNEGSATGEAADTRIQASSGENNINDDDNNGNNNNDNNNFLSARPDIANLLQRGGERNRGEETNYDGEDGNEESESEDDSVETFDNLSTSRLEFDVGDLIDRDRILNNLMQMQRGMLRDMEGGVGTSSQATDLKCPVCNEVFVDYEASDHPNAPAKRSGTSTKCSHGALCLFTKLHHCPICFEEDIEPPNVVALACGHVVCKEDFCKLGGHVGIDRPGGCPTPKPVPGRTSSVRADNNDDDDNNNNVGGSRFIILPSLPHP
jgi:hypothetical protein